MAVHVDCGKDRVSERHARLSTKDGTSATTDLVAIASLRDALIVSYTLCRFCMSRFKCSFTSQPELLGRACPPRIPAGRSVVASGAAAMSAMRANVALV